MPAMKSFHIITFGCQMNEHDSERMTGILEAQGSTLVSDPGQAEMIILNTCSIREKAEQKFYSELGRLRQLKTENPNLKIAVAGCIAQQEGRKILSRAPYVDMIFGPSDIAKISDIVEAQRVRRNPVIDIEGDAEYHHKLVPTSRTDSLKAWVSIMYGCDNFCTYCIVPYLRGRERSRPPGDIVKEVHDLAEKGYKEVTLLGQNVNSYGKGLGTAVNFPELLNRVNDVVGIERIRFVTSHPKDLSDGLITALSDLLKVCESIHLPAQSGSDRILAAMNRRYTAAAYLDKVKKLREAVPGIALTTDIIVGFPGETEDDFSMTMKLLRDVSFDSIFAFKYSQRPNTVALELARQVPEDVKEARLAQALELQQDIALQKNKDLIGTVQEVLVEGPSKKGETLTGRTRGNKAVNFIGQASLRGSLAQVRIRSAAQNSLSGEICG